MIAATVVESVHHSLSLSGIIPVLLGYIAQSGVPLAVPITLRTVRIATGVGMLLGGVLLWAVSEKTTKQNRRGILLAGAGAVLVIVIPAIKALLWVFSLGN